MFFLIFLADTYTCPTLVPLIPLFWISGDVSSGFQSQSGLPYSHCRGKCNVCSLRSIPGATLCQPLDSKHCGMPTGFISCPRILLAPVIYTFFYIYDYGIFKRKVCCHFRGSLIFFKLLKIIVKRLAGVSPEVDLRECSLHLPPQKANTAEPTLALKPTGNITGNPKEGYLWPKIGHVNISAKNNF